MSRSRVGLFAILSLWLLLEGCVIAPPRLAAPRPDEWRYRRTAEAFINYGVKDNISGMLRLTSPLVIRENSEAKVRSAFEKYSIPLLKGATVRLDMKGVAYFEPDTSYPAYTFAGTFIKGAKILPLSIFVGNEAGIYCVVGLKIYGRR